MFIQVFQGKTKDANGLRQQLDRWEQELGAGAKGYLGSTGGVAADGTAIFLARFDSEAAARANSDRPEQGAWWNETAKYFDGEVTFRDCKEVDTTLAGGSDDAGFVQVMRGRVMDAEKLRKMTTDQEMTAMLHQARPDIIGSTLIIEDDGTFTETIAFTDEAAARVGEKQEMPEAVAAEWKDTVADVEYYDLHHPWFGKHR